VGGRTIATLAAAAALTALGAAPAHAAGFLAGAAKRVTTPPAAGSPAGSDADAKYAPQFAACSTPATTEGRFALQEPFVDVNGNRQWDPGVSADGSTPSTPPEPYCDANGNGRWDGIYADNAFAPVQKVHDDIDARAVAFSDGRHKPVVYVSVDEIGLFDFYTDRVRADLKQLGVDADVVVSANHNESSPDSIGLYGAPEAPAVPVGLRSGIDEYYMDFLADQEAHAAADAVHRLEPARLYANQTPGAVPDGAAGGNIPVLAGITQNLSDQFPTSVANPRPYDGYAANDDRAAAVDPKLGVLQARGGDGRPIFTVMSFAGHNQEMGGAGPEISADWPGAFERSFDASHAGLSVFLVGDNGSEEDPQTDPTAIPDGAENKSHDVATQFRQATATGERFAELTDAATKTAARLRAGDVTLHRRELCVPLENNGFVALAGAGEFGRRQGYACDANGNPVAPVPNGFASPTASAQFRTFVGYASIGPDLQLVDNPGESFPALMLGSPFGAEDASCDRPNPAVPTWHARAAYRFQVGLADDLIGYLIPAWGFASGAPGLFNNDSCYADAHGRHHKLESESVGPTAGNSTANALAALLDGERDASARIVQHARFVEPDGSYSRWPTGAAGILVPGADASGLDPNGGTLIGAPTVGGFGGRAVDANGLFMDYDGQPQPRPDVTTRGMIVLDARGCVSARYYLDVFPPSDGSRHLGAARPQPAVLPQGACSSSAIQPGAAQRSQIAPARCADRTRPRSRVRGRPRRGGGRLLLRGTASDRGRCHGRIARVTVTVRTWSKHGRCRFLKPSGRLNRRARCRRGPRLLARGRGRWRLRVRARLPRGHYVLVVRAVDTHGNEEHGHRRGPDVARLRVR
jgi:hypothetical protein